MNKILIVEDNKDIVELLKDDLKANGFEVFVCEDGYQGVEFSRKVNPDLILLDIMLPAGGGLYVLEKIRVPDAETPVPIIILTASKDPEHRKKAEQFNIQAYIEKPYESEELISKIREILQQ